MFGGETCHVHVKVDHAGHRNSIQKYTFATRVRTLNRFKNDYHRGQGFALLNSFSLVGGQFLSCGIFLCGDFNTEVKYQTPYISVQAS